jgi:hypothetical protein
VSQKRTEMDQLQEMVRLHRMGTGYREVARLLGISPTTEREYRQILAAEGLLAGPVEALPELAALKAAVGKHLGERRTPQQTSSVEQWSETVRAMMAKEATPKAIYDCLRLEHQEFAGSLSAIKRLCARLRGDTPVGATDIAIPVVSAPGEIAQVDFGYVGKLYDPAQGVLRKVWVFVMVLTYSRHLFPRVVFDQRVTTWDGAARRGLRALWGCGGDRGPRLCGRVRNPASVPDLVMWPCDRSVPPVASRGAGVAT